MIYTDHPVVKRANYLDGRRLRLKQAMKGRKGITDEKFIELTQNMDWQAKQIRQMIKLIKNDSEKLLTIHFEGTEEWLDFTMTDAVLLKITRLNAILEKKLDETERAARIPRSAQDVINRGF